MLLLFPIFHWSWFILLNLAFLGKSVWTFIFVIYRQHNSLNSIPIMQTRQAEKLSYERNYNWVSWVRGIHQIWVRHYILRHFNISKCRQHLLQPFYFLTHIWRKKTSFIFFLFTFSNTFLTLSILSLPIWIVFLYSSVSFRCYLFLFFKVKW